MTTSFDSDMFDYRYGKIVALPVSTSFEERVKEILQLSREFAGVGDESARRYVERAIDKLTLYALIDTCQSFTTVCEQFRSNVGRGFNSPWDLGFSTIEFAEYCRDNKQPSEGLSALRNARHHIAIADLPIEQKEELYRVIDKSIGRLSTENEQ